MSWCGIAKVATFRKGGREQMHRVQRTCLIHSGLTNWHTNGKGQASFHFVEISYRHSVNLSHTGQSGNVASKFSTIHTLQMCLSRRGEIIARVISETLITRVPHCTQSEARPLGIQEAQCSGGHLIQARFFWCLCWLYLLPSHTTSLHKPDSPLSQS